MLDCFRKDEPSRSDAHMAAWGYPKGATFTYGARRMFAALVLANALFMNLLGQGIAETFTISLDQTVSRDQPGVGAGRIGKRGEQDIYVFEGAPGQSIFLDMLTHDPNLSFVTWEVFDPTGKSISLQCFACRDHGFLTLPRTGEYQIVVGRSDLNVVGDYAFRLYSVPDPQEFHIALGTEIDGKSTEFEGAGVIESPGARDEYLFQVEAGQQIVFRLIAFERTLDDVNWSLFSPTLGALYSGDLAQYSPSIITLNESGIFSLVIGDSESAALGSYHFQLDAIPPPDELPIDVSQALELDSSLPGAGFIQVAGAADVYSWTMAEPGWLFLDLVDADRDLQFAEWQLLGPENQRVLSTHFFSGDPGLVYLSQAGEYRMTIGGNIASGKGAYRIHLQPVPANEEFSIELGDLITFNQPGEGAGHIGVPGAQDVYRFNAVAGQSVFVESLQADRELGFLSWRMEDPEGRVLFEECLRCKDPGVLVLSESGSYQVIVGGSQHAGTGKYAFRIWTVPPPELFSKGMEPFEVVPAQNGTGEGILNVPGEVDTYLIRADKPETWHFRPTLGSGSPTLMWRLITPGKRVLFDGPLRPAASYAQFITITQQGTYRLECYHASTTQAHYGFQLERLEHCPVSNEGGGFPLPSLTIAFPESGNVLNDSEVTMAGSIGESPGVRGIDLVLALDSSESLQTTDPQDLRLSAVRNFVKAMPKGLNIRIALVDFDQSARLVQPLTENFEQVLARLDQFDQSGGTNIEQAMQVALDEILAQDAADVARSIILFSDGESSAGSAADAAFRASNENVKVHTVYLGADPSEGSALLQTIAGATCANYRHAKSAAQLVDIFRNIASPVPIKRMEALSSARPGQVFPVEFVGQFWGVSGLPVTTGENGEASLTVRLITDEEPERMVEQSVVVRFQNSVNAAPVLTPPSDIVIFEDRSRILTLNAQDSDHDTNLLSWSFRTDRPDLFPENGGWQWIVQHGRARLRLSPAADHSGSATGTLRVTDPEGAFSEADFLISVREVNDRPFFDPVEDLVMNPGEGVRAVLIKGIHDGSTFENQHLTITARSEDAALIDDPEVIYDGASQTGQILIRPVMGAEGTTRVELALSDGESVNGMLARQFQITVLKRPNQGPSIRWIHPENASKFFEGDIVSLEVEAFDPDGSVHSVTFFANDQMLSKRSPVTTLLQWKPDTTGFYELKALVEDDNQAVAQTEYIRIEVVERPPDFTLGIVTPEDSTVVCVGQLVDIEVELAGGDPDGNVVHFFAGDELRGVRNAPPYTFQWEADEVGDFLLSAVAFREDGSTVVSEPVRAGVSDTCLQVALLVDDPGSAELALIQEYLFEMGVGSRVVHSGEITTTMLDRFDLAMVIVDDQKGVQPIMVQALKQMISTLSKSVFILGHRIASNTESLSESEKAQWHQLIHLRSFGSQIVTEPLNLQETGFFRNILDGRFGHVEPFVLSFETDRGIADDEAEVIGFSGDTDLVVRSPAGNEPDFGQARTVSLNFTLAGNGDDHSVMQRKRLFQNAVCWAMRCGGCSNAVLPVLPVSWQAEARTGEQVHQTFLFVNNGACELTGGRVELFMPEGVALEEVIMSQGLGWSRNVATGRVVLNLGRLTSGAGGGVQAQLLMRAVSPGDYTISICSSSNNTGVVCSEQILHVTGEQLSPPKIRIRRNLNGELSLVVRGQEGVRYRVEYSSDFVNWFHFGNAEGIESIYPVPTNDQGIPIILFYRASIQP
ncbi:MAG: VWA domain-containing protein [Verrucomicrobia bacterium]|nr:VWA domain-containing protein [Verrucomicrobiota bacterium]